MMRPLLLLVSLLGCATSGPTPASKVPPAPSTSIRVLLTSDEHGWMEPYKDEDAKMLRGGLVLAEAALQAAGLDEPDVVLLSGGDSWTGPFASTVLQGAPMVDAMNALGYRAAAIGNHEFDFGVRNIAVRGAQARFPLLAANIYQAASRRRPDWAGASTIIDVGGHKLGVVGLATITTPETTDPRHVIGHSFLPYADILREAVPKLRAQGATEVMVLMHEALTRAKPLAPLLRELGVHLVSIGHAHHKNLFVDDGGTPKTADDIVFCNPGAFLRSYCQVDLYFDGRAPVAEIYDIAAPFGVVLKPSARLKPILAATAKKADALGNELLAMAPDGISRDGGLGRLVVDSWLERFPSAKGAITNGGGLRQDIPRGGVRFRDVVSAMPFANTLVIVELTAAQIREAAQHDAAITSGIQLDGDDVLVGGALVKDKARIIVNDFIYRGGDGFRFHEWAKAEETGVDWRDPIYQHLRTLHARGQVVSNSKTPAK